MIIDLTYPIHKGMFKYPSDPELEVIVTAAQKKEGKIPSETKYKSGNVLLTLRNHLGTHVDAPAHKIEGGKSIDQYGLEKFINRCVLIDLTPENVAYRGNKGVTTGDLAGKIEFQYLKDNNITAVLFYTGFCDRLSQMEGKLSGEDKLSFEKEFTYLTQEAGQYMASNAPFLNVMGLDSFAFDPSGSNSESHRAFFGNDTLLLETAFNLKAVKDKIGVNPFELISAPLQYRGADAAQVRAYTIYDGGR